MTKYLTAMFGTCDQSFLHLQIYKLKNEFDQKIISFFYAFPSPEVLKTMIYGLLLKYIFCDINPWLQFHMPIQHMFDDFGHVELLFRLIFVIL